MSTLVCQTQVALQNETLLVGPGHGRQICNHHSVTATLWSGCLAGGRRGAAAPSSDSHVRPAKCDCVHQSAALHPVPAQGQFVALHLLMLGCAVLYCAVLCCAVPCYASLRYAVLCSAMLCYLIASSHAQRHRSSGKSKFEHVPRVCFFPYRISQQVLLTVHLVPIT